MGIKYASILSFDGDITDGHLIDTTIWPPVTSRSCGVDVKFIRSSGGSLASATPAGAPPK